MLVRPRDCARLFVAIIGSIFFCSNLPVSGQSSQHPIRTWTSSVGTTVEASLIEHTDRGLVRLERRDGTVLEVPFDKFSPRDQAYLQKLAIVASSPRRILFIGNRYTDQMRAILTGIVDASIYGEFVEIEFIAPGGQTLREHLANDATMNRIRGGSWDVVVLQGQSQTPALFPSEFLDAAEAIHEIIDQAGAKTIFYETWGRRDGDPLNPRVFPDFESMQEALTVSYKEAAKRCRAELAPVGQTWAALREKHPDLSKRLYREDGSHPSELGASLAACVFYGVIFDADPRQVDFDPDLSADEVRAIYSVLPQVLL